MTVPRGLFHCGNATVVHIDSVMNIPAVVETRLMSKPPDIGGELLSAGRSAGGGPPRILATTKRHQWASVNSGERNAFGSSTVDERPPWSVWRNGARPTCGRDSYRFDGDISAEAGADAFILRASSGQARSSVLPASEGVG